MTRLQCDMDERCRNEVTHLGDKGFVYCSSCAPDRIGWERVRKLQGWEKRSLLAGEMLVSYRPISRTSALKRRAAVSDTEEVQK